MQSPRLKTIFLSCLALLLFSSCGSVERQDISETPYMTSGVEQFFLPELPTWANVSASGKCSKTSSFQYLDVAKIFEKYQLSYVEMIELQGQYNQRREDYFRSTAHRFLKPVEESSLFSNALEQVRGGVRQFRLPNVPAVDVVWLESYLQNNKLTELKKLVESGKFDEKLPILFSSCFSNQRLSQWVAENGLEQVGFYLLSAEWLTPYGSDNALKTGLQIEIGKLLNPGVKINIIVPPGSNTPSEIVI